VELLLQCQLDSEIYNHLTKTLDLVGELSRAALENAHATASETTIQVTGRGELGGGSGRRGCSEGRGGPRGHGGGFDDEDDLGNFQL